MECTYLLYIEVKARQTIPISILNLKEARTVTDLDREDASFMWKTLLIDCIMNMDYNDPYNNDEPIQIFKKNIRTIKRSLI